MRDPKFSAAVLGACLIAAPVLGVEEKLSGEEIGALLPTIRAIGEETSQTFGNNGATNYSEKGRESFGQWWVEADQYCSSWPPNSGKACYDVLRDDNKLIWVGESGQRILNTFEAK